MKYRVSGTIEMNWTAVVEAENEDEAASKAVLQAEDGNIEFGPPLETPDEGLVSVQAL